MQILPSDIFFIYLTRAIRSGLAEENDGQSKNDIDKILEAFESRSKTFDTGFTILIGLSLFFFFFILFPYVTVQYESKRIANDLLNVTESMNRTQSLFDTFQQVKLSYDNLERRIAYGPTELLDEIQNVSDEISTQANPQQQQQQTTQLDPSCSNKLHDIDGDGLYSDSEKEDYLNCHAGTIVKAVLGKYVDIARRKITLPLQNLSSEYKSGLEPSALQNALSELQAPTIRTIQDNPGFWKSRVNKESVFSQVLIKVNETWTNGYESSINIQTTRLGAVLGKLEASKALLEAEATELASRQTEISQRLDEFESPFGTFPIGFVESITVFPIALTGGFLAVSSFLAETIRLRSLFHRLYYKQRMLPTRLRRQTRQLQRRRETLDKITHEIILNTAPLRIEPTEKAQKKLLQFLVLLLPLVIFIASVVLISFSWTLDDSVTGNSGERFFFATLYGICLGLLIVAGYVRIFRALQHYKSPK